PPPRRSRHNRVVADDRPFGILPVVDGTLALDPGRRLGGGSPADRGGVPRARLLLRHRSRRRAGAAGPADPGLRRVLRAAAGGQDGDPHGPRRPGLAGILPGGRRTHLRPARPEGGAVLRRRTRPRRSPGARRAAAARTEPFPATGTGAARG